MPPVRTTVCPAASALSASNCAAGSELVTIVMPAIERNSRDSAIVVVPAETAIELPGFTKAAACAAMAALASNISRDFAPNPGSSVAGASGANPCA